MKYLHRILMLVLCICICFTSSANAATSSIVMDIDTGEIISSSNAHELRYPASLTKMMTLYLTFHSLEKGLIRMEDEFPVSRVAANRAPSRLGLRAGDKIKIEDAVKALIVKSANDCATVLAEGLGYDEKIFAEAMTGVAKELGMKNTTFKNASGLPNREQKTTAHDMAILSAAIYKHFPQYYDLFSLKSFEYNGTTFRTHNLVLKNFADADGLKTGYTAAAGYNIATSAMREDARVIAVTMGHKTQKGRDLKVVEMMDSSLNKIAGIVIKDKKTMLAEIVLSKKPELEEEAIQIAEKIEDIWAIKLGYFSNYTKARNYAKMIRKQNSNEMFGKRIEVEVEEVEAAIVYNSKIVGLSKENANNLCNSLKETKKSCIVVASNQLHLAYKK